MKTRVAPATGGTARASVRAAPDGEMPGGEVPGGPPMLGASPLARIRMALPTLPDTLRTCAEFVLAHPWQVRGLSIYDLAKQAGVSSPAVNRLSRRIGYAGYREFSQQLALELGRLAGAAYSIPEPLSRRVRAGADGADGAGQDGDEVATVVSQVLAMEQAALQDTWRSLDRDAAARAVRALARARQILFISTGSGLGACEVAVYRFKVLGMRAASVSDPGSVVPEIHLLEPGDVVVGVSYHGHSRGVVEGLAYARERELTTICITAAAGSPIAQGADIALVVLGRDEALGFAQFASRVSTAALLEALTAAVAWVHKDTAVPHANEVTLAAQRRSSMFDPPTAGGRRGSRSRPRERDR